MHKILKIKKTKIILSILDILQNEGYITYTYNPFTQNIQLTANNINNIRVISTPGKRIYVNKDNIPTGAIIKTSKGYITDIEAKILKLGGEIILIYN